MTQVADAYVHQYTRLNMLRFVLQVSPDIWPDAEIFPHSANCQNRSDSLEPEFESWFTPSDIIVLPKLISNKSKGVGRI